MKIWVDEIAIGDLNAELQMIAEDAGLEVVKDLLKNCAGMNFYVPGNAPKELVRRLIKRDFDGSAISGKRIARRCEISEAQFLKILREIRTEELAVNDERSEVV